MSLRNTIRNARCDVRLGQADNKFGETECDRFSDVRVTDDVTDDDRCISTSGAFRWKKDNFRRVTSISMTAVVLAALLQVRLVTAFNLDINFPVIKTGPRHSYFGFSLAQHLVHNRQINRSIPVLLIGAPRDNVSESDDASVRPGSVYSCPVTSLHNDCQQLNLDNEARPGEDKTDRWLGVSVASQTTANGGAMACAHRHRRVRPAFEAGLGLCVSLTNALDEGKLFEPCDGKPHNKGQSDYGYCQAGTSLAFAQDGSVLFGAPGSYNYRGSVFSNILTSDFDSFPEWHQSPVEDPRPNEPKSVPGPATNYYSYLGMSTKVGYLLDGQKTFIAGAPRSKLIGQVLLFKATDSGGMTIDDNHYLTGEQLGSGFGHALATADFNNDGLQDLVVSAPFYHEPHISGAVYVYINGPQGIGSKSVPIRLFGKKFKDADCIAFNCRASWFGFSISDAGDLDQDGFPDLVVGAPFEGPGAVYVFRGSAGGLTSTWSQRILATELRNPLSMLDQQQSVIKSFGYSLATGLDVDGNGYPDIAIGAFQSDAAILLRTRPVVNIFTQLHTHPAPIDPTKLQCDRDGLSFNCFKLQACLRFSMNTVNRFNGTLTVDLTVESEQFTGASVSRAFFLKNGKEIYNHTERLTMHKQTSPHYKCTDIQAYIIKGNRDFLNPIRFRLTYQLTQSDSKPLTQRGDKLQDLSLYPVINESLARVFHNVEFVKNCGTDSRCESNLLVRGMLELERDESGQYVLKVGPEPEFRLFVRVKNTGEDAHDTMLTVTLPPSLEYRSADSTSCDANDGIVICDVGNPLPANEETSFSIRLNINMLESTAREMDIVIQVNTTSSDLDDQDNMDVIKIKMVIETDLAVKGFSNPGHVFYGGKVVGESAISYLEDIGSEIVHGYEITNKGHAKVRNTVVTVSWPYEVSSSYANGKHLLYLTEHPQVKPNGQCTIERGRINPLQLPSRTSSEQVEVSFDDSMPLPDSVSYSQNVRRKRDVTGPPPEALEVGIGANSNVATLDCSTGTARCCLIVCNIEMLQPNDSAVITVKSRLWNSTFLEDYVSVHHVNIFSKAKLSIDPSLNIRQLSRQNDEDQALTKAFPDVQVQKPTDVPYWAIILSICVGMLLLALIVLLLSKCGFFRRRQQDDVIFYTATKVKQKSSYHYDED